MERLSWRAQLKISRELRRTGRSIKGIVNEDLNRPRLVPAAAKNLLEGLLAAAGVGLAAYFFLPQDAQQSETPVRPEHEVRDQMPDLIPPVKPVQEPEGKLFERPLVPVPPEKLETPRERTLELEQRPRAIIKGIKPVRTEKIR